MDQNPVSDRITHSGSDSTIADLIQEHQVFGITAMLMGLSQVLYVLEIPRAGLWSSWSIFVLGAGGWLLIGIGMNVFQGRNAFDGGWIDSGRVTWLWLVSILLLSIGVATTTGWVVLF